MRTHILKVFHRKYMGIILLQDFLQNLKLLMTNDGILFINRCNVKTVTDTKSKFGTIIVELEILNFGLLPPERSTTRKEIYHQK